MKHRFHNKRCGGNGTQIQCLTNVVDENETQILLSKRCRINETNSMLGRLCIENETHITDIINVIETNKSQFFCLTSSVKKIKRKFYV
jgi:hypothetical protein